MGGKMSEDEVMVYIEIIKLILSNQEEEQEEYRESREEKEREELAERILNLSDELDAEVESGGISNSVYRDLKDKLMESVLEHAEEDPNFLLSSEQYKY